MPKRTQDEILRQIEALRRCRQRIPEVSFFGGNNHEKIDAQISVLEEKSSADDYYVDERSEEYEDGDNDTYFEAEKAEMWLNGQTDEDLADEDYLKA